MNWKIVVLKVEIPFCPLTGAWQTKTSNGSFTVPAGVTSLRVLCVGGGAGGAGVHWGGGGSGNVSSGTFTVTPGSVHTVTVGPVAAGGPGGDGYGPGAAGGSSAFGSLLSCSGGSAALSAQGASGGSGGGAGCWYVCSGGFGGTNGADGQYITGANSGFYAGGTGQGTFAPHFALFTQNTFSAGAGGAAVANPWDAAGSGGGGVLMNGTGPSGQQGANALYSGRVVWGTGEEGGLADVTDSCPDGDAGGNGASGLVYVSLL